FSESTVIRRAMTPYGTVLNGSGTWPDNRTLLGDPNPSSTGLVDIGARKFNPATGLFVSVDPKLDVGSPQTMTGYTYAADSPVTNADPTGLMFVDCGGGGGNPSPIPTYTSYGVSTAYLGYGLRAMYLPSVYASSTRWVVANAQITHSLNGGSANYFKDPEAQFRYN